MKNISEELFEYARDVNDLPMLSAPNNQNNIADHFHRQMEILYVTQGHIQVKINEVTKILCKDQVAISDSYDIHSLVTLEPEKTLSIDLIIPYTAMTEYLAEKQSRSLKNNFITDKNTVAKIKSFIDLLYVYWTPTINNITNHICQALLAMISKEIGFCSVQNNCKQLLQSEILQFIADNFLHDLTIETVAAKFGYSKYYFSKIFFRSFKTTFNDYIKILKVQRAIKLLQTERISVLEAATRAGFNSEATFYRFIKKNLHCSPKQLTLQPLI